MWQSSGKYQPRKDQLEQVAPAIIDMGCFSRVETNGGAFEQVNLLYGENPNHAVRSFTALLHQAGIQTHMLDRGLNGLRMYPVPADVRQLMYRVKHAQGVDITRIFCGLNDVRNIIPSIHYALEAGMIPQATLCITHSPIHTVEYYVDIAEQLIAAGAPEICLKDMAGIGRPAMLGRLVKSIKDKYPDILIQYHGHSGPGLSMASILEVCRNGADIIDVAIEPISWGKIHPDVISVQAMLEDAGFDVPKINMKAYMQVRTLTQNFIDDFLGYFMDESNKQMSSLLLKSGLPGGMMGSMMADLKGVHAGINRILSEQEKQEMTIDDLLLALFDEVEYVWPKLGYPPLVTPFSQYVKNVALMNLMALAKGEERYSMIDRNTWDMILGKCGKLPGSLAPEIVEIAKSKGYEFSDVNPQDNYPDQLNTYRQEMQENGWETGEDEEELFELAMHDRQYRDYKSGIAKQRFEDELQRAKDAAMGKGYSEDEVRKLKRMKAEPIVAYEKGKVLWEVTPESPSQAPAIGKKYTENEVFCYISTPWNTFDTVPANFNGRIIEVCAQQGTTVNKGDVLAYIERSEQGEKIA
jgi:pyruvate carboxylase subunit B